MLQNLQWRQGLDGYPRSGLGQPKIQCGIYLGNVNGIRDVTATRNAGLAKIRARMRTGKNAIFGIAMRGVRDAGLSWKRSRKAGLKVPSRFFGIRDFPYLKLGIRDCKAKSGRDSGLKVCARVRMPEITLGITGLHEILGRDYRIKEPYCGPSD